MERERKGCRGSDPQIEFLGNRQVLVEGCGGILEYEPETVKLRTGKYNIRLNGRDLRLKHLTMGVILVEGCLTGLEFMT